MKHFSITQSTASLAALTLLTAAPAALQAQATIPLVTNTNSSDITSGNNDFMSQVNPGQTLYVGLLYTGGAFSSPEAVDYFTVSLYALSSGGDGSLSFNFFTGTDTGAGLTGISPLAGVTPGTASVAALVSDNPSAPGNTALAEVTGLLEYSDAPGNPFAPTTGGVLWLGITNTGGSTLNYYAGSPFGSPAPTYTFATPFTAGADGLSANTYTYNGNSTLAAADQNVHPYLNVTAVTVPEPGGTLLILAAGSLALLHRRKRPMHATWGKTASSGTRLL